ncbi:MAG: 3-deoxy-manno-octulosonate cytidylyltransferase [Candidatus Reddybacter sp.]
MKSEASNWRYAIVIPARYQSSRFPGKPLADILGKVMVERVWEQCCKAVAAELVYIATDSKLIRDKCLGFGAQVVMTSSSCLTGTDRLAEANEQLNCDFLINVQGDEPIIEPNDILKVLRQFQQVGNVTNAYCRINSESEFRSLTVPKVVFSQSKKLKYMSRSPIPITKSGGFSIAHKQVCIYAFSREQLKFFADHKQKTPLEAVEDIEILRFLEADIPVDMVEVDSGSIAVDIPSDVNNVIEFLKNCDDRLT